MKIVHKSLASLYEADIINSYEAAKNRSRDNQAYLEKSGFTVTSNDLPIAFEGSRNLIATKGAVMLQVTQLLRGGTTYSLVVKNSKREKKLHLAIDSIEEAVAFANAALEAYK